MARHARRHWKVGYSVAYTDGRKVPDTVTIGPCRFEDIPEETGYALGYLMALPEVRGINISAVRSARALGADS